MPEITGTKKPPRWAVDFTVGTKNPLTNYAHFSSGNQAFISYLSGADCKIRTCDPIITNDVLYQLS